MRSGSGRRRWWIGRRRRWIGRRTPFTW
ncbi:hypothetical protein E2C01_100268 [Portunus trituberculatus]|uniref:Uncharacterized protein n=1 Tax=Portunus trituberculatus TaxID=210409 RepID=A0A5B7KJ05_PORTR|nr:hypothetical protein [Portunus trituberculatus]